MNCFVIMPFSKEFNDVYATIKTSVERAFPAKNGCCFRLDETRPAGRITDRLLKELRSASLCVADLTGARPNVMWEVGYAMALQRPTIIVTQSMVDLPFDVQDMQTLEYDRNNLTLTLGAHLHQIVIDTLAFHGRNAIRENDDRQLVGDLLNEIRDLKTMVAEAVQFKTASNLTAKEKRAVHTTLANLEGAWSSESSNLYAELIDGDLIVPYCYRGDSDLTGVYFGWEKRGEYWFARFAWLQDTIAGFSFMKYQSIDTLNGAWWGDLDDLPKSPSMSHRPPDKSGVPVTWRRQADKPFPRWARTFLNRAKKNGLPRAVLSRAEQT